MLDKLILVQQELKAPKNKKNTFANYNYRSCEDILEAVKPLLSKHGLLMTISDSIELIGDRFYVAATATITDGKETISSKAYARESLEKKGNDASQVTGTASSYARKYALNGLLLIDDTKDPDTDEYAKQTGTDKAEAGKKVNSSSDWANQKIEKKHAYVFQKKCDEYGIDPRKYAEQFGIKNVMDMTMGQFRMAMDDIEGKE